MFSIGVFAIICNKKQQILLSHRNDMDVWNLPGGGMEDKETPQKALKREVFEETGLKIRIKRLVSLNMKPQKNELVMTFECVTKTDEAVTTDEADKHEWFSFDNLPLNTVPKQLERIKHFFEQPKKVFMSTQKSPSTKSLLVKDALEEFNRNIMSKS